jgi:GGDEF domain-containing protein
MTIDSITGLSSIRSYDRDAVLGAAMLIDVDMMKRGNGEFGWAEGDAVLRFVSQIIQDTALGASVYRYRGNGCYGNGFAVMLPAIPEAEAVTLPSGYGRRSRVRCRCPEQCSNLLSKTLLTRLNITGWWHSPNGADVFVAQARVSVGGATASSLGDTQPAALLAEAERSVISAKRLGGNRVETR